jgi:hypothetical protein
MESNAITGRMMFGDPIYSTFILFLFVILGILLLGVTIYAVIAKITNNPGKTAAAQPFVAKKNDRASLRRIINRINRHGDIRDPDAPRPLVALEEFFDGNNDYGSIGCNFGPKQPSPHEFHELFLSIRNKPVVHDVRVHIPDHEDPNRWPSTEMVWNITSAGTEDVRQWFGGKYEADNLLRGFPDTVKLEKVPIPAKMKAIGVWWD